MNPEPAVKPEAERRRLEESREREFLIDCGVSEEDIPKLTSQAVSNSSACKANHYFNAHDLKG